MVKNKTRFDKKNWALSGLSWGALMFLTLSIAYPYFVGQEITLKSLLQGLILWTIVGLGFGYLMKLLTNKPIHEKDSSPTSHNV